MSETVTPRRQVRWLGITGALLLMIGAIAISGALGWWQWTRANSQSVTVSPDPAVPIVDVMAPATSPGSAIGRQVIVTGEWADVDAAVVPGREVDGVEAELLVRPLILDAELTGTGESATIAVIVGWRPAGDVIGPDSQPGEVSFEGYLRSGEQSNLSTGLPTSELDGAFWASSMSVAELAQVWPAPLYSAVLVSYQGSASWEPLPPREPESSINIQSLAYSFEWWIFGGFAVFIGLRWIRDNGFAPRGEPGDADADDASDAHVEAHHGGHVDGAIREDKA